MPGGRLTHEDRRRIAGWLDEGLGYAEIGRLLGRPTSTISREVARNGAPGDYRPARAQHAADHRARRRTPPPPAEPVEPVHAFVEEFATHLAASGLPRMTSRVLVCLLTADTDGRTSADLVRRLRVSPASVSKSIGTLVTMDLVVRTADPGTRRERYLIDEHAWLRAWQSDAGAHSAVAQAALRGVEIFGADTPAGARLRQMGEFFGRISGRMSGRPFAGQETSDAFTLLAALANVARPLTATELATALDWPPDRVHDAVTLIERHPAIADPFVLRVHPFALDASPQWLSSAQRAALKHYD